METYPQNDGKWVATIWLVREFYKAEGSDEQDAIAKLKEHLRCIIPIYENDIQVTQERIQEINRFLAQDLVSL